MNKLVKFPGGAMPTTTDDLIKGLTNMQQEIRGSTGGMPFLRLLRTGVFAYGPENIEPEADSLWAINPRSVHHGWAAWGDGELIDEVMLPFNTPLTPKSELQDYGVDWAQQFSVLMQCVSGEDKGQTVMYKGTSIGLHNAVKGILEAIVTQAQADPDHIVPVVELNVDSYHHKKYGETFYPVLDIVEWLSMDGESADEDEAEESEVEQPEPVKPAAKRGSAKKKMADKGPKKSGNYDPDDSPDKITSRRRRRRAS